MTGLKAVTFDLWDTIIQEVPRKNPSLGEFRINAMRRELSSIGLDYDRDAVSAAYRKSGEYCDGHWEESRDLTVEEHLNFMLGALDAQLLQKLDGKGAYGRIKKVYEEAILSMPPVAFGDVIGVLTVMKEKGYLIGLISNTGRTPGTVLRRVLDGMGIADRFDFMTFSNELLIRKPRKEIFHHTMRGLGVGMGEAVHVGDDLERDFLGAIGSGMRAVLIDRRSEKDLEKPRISSLTELQEIL